MKEQMIAEHEEIMRKTIEDLRTRLSTIRTGKASVNMLNNIKVDYYGSMVPINQTAGVNVPEPRLITVSPWDKNMLPIIEKALLASDLGITPSNDGSIIRLAIPELTEERRLDLVKQVKQHGEDHKVALRNIRRDANDQLKKMQKNSDISEDQEHDGFDEVQKLTDKFVAEVDEILQHKEVEIMEV
ncbi:MAG: ribosome recycling factor [Candidatus Delongbacteria bacterium]|nr:ribosome recycling factor [Candidatus Delongbacteria bacterium]